MGIANRIELVELSVDDGRFIVALFQQPSVVRFIGNKGIRSLNDARRYIISGPQQSYCDHGVGLWLVRLKESKTPIGLCGFVQRDCLDSVDLGFAFLEQFQSKGFAYEAASCCLTIGKQVGISLIYAITDKDNFSSRRLLSRLKMRPMENQIADVQFAQCLLYQLTS